MSGVTVSIGWLLRQPGLGLVLRAGRAGLDRPIGFVQPTELPDPRPWLSGGELVLTTGLGLRAADGEPYVRRLAEAGVAALGFGTGLSHDRIPDPVVHACEAVGLALLEVPYTTPFAAISRAVNARLAEQEYELVRRAADTQVRITRAALRGGLAAIVRELAAATGTAVVYVDERTERAVAHPAAAAGLAAQLPQLRRAGADSSTLVQPGRTVTVQPVGRDGVLLVQAERRLENVELVLIGHAVSLLTLELDKPRRLRDERNRLGAKVFGLLLRGALGAEEALEYLVDAVGRRNRIRVLRVRGGDPQHLARELDRALDARHRPCYAVRDGAELTVLLRDDDTPAAVRTLLAGLSATAGLSAPHRLSEARQAAEQAGHALAAAGPAEPVVEFDATAGTALLADPQVRSVLAAVASSTVAVLAEHDARHGSQLVASLRAFLEANGHWESAAAVLGVHRHTLRGRMARVQRLLGVDLDDARVRAELLLALLSAALPPATAR